MISATIFTSDSVFLLNAHYKFNMYKLQFKLTVCPVCELESVTKL